MCPLRQKARTVPSKAKARFKSNCRDIDRLLEIHKEKGGNKAGRRRRLEVLNKAGVVLLCAFWEAFCEDLAAEGVEHLVAYANDWTDLPKALQKKVAKELEDDQHELAVWKLAGNGWRTVLKSRLADFTTERNWHLNAPKSENIDKMFDDALGVTRVSSSWRWPGSSTAQTRVRLDEFVQRRGAIAHRGSSAHGTRRYHVDQGYDLLQRLVEKTGNAVNNALSHATGEAMW